MQHLEGNIFSNIWAMGIKLLVTADTYTYIYLCNTFELFPSSFLLIQENLPISVEKRDSITMNIWWFKFSSKQQ